MNTALFVALTLVAGAPKPKEPAAKEPPSIVGEWVGESGTRSGQPHNPDPGTTITITADGKLILKEGKRDKPEEGTYTADPKKNPAEIDLVPQLAAKGPTILGIYKIPGVGKNIDPDDVTISCAKSGYKEANVVRRPRRASDSKDPVEVECYLQKQ